MYSVLPSLFDSNQTACGGRFPKVENSPRGGISLTGSVTLVLVSSAKTIETIEELTGPDKRAVHCTLQLQLMDGRVGR